MVTVVHNGRIHTPQGPGITAMVIDGATVAWLGGTDAVAAHLDSADEVVNLGGALVTPAFVDAHVHLTATGLAVTGLDLTSTRSAAEVLDRVAAFAAGSDAAVVLGSGWDDSSWIDPLVPTAGELQRAGSGRPVYLARVDAHSALVSADFLAAVPLPGGEAPAGEPEGWVRGERHDAIRRLALSRLGRTDRRRAQTAALADAAALGIAAVHEMAGPSISSAEDLIDLLAPDPGRPAVEIVGYWGELGAAATARELGAAGAAGDLFCDGAIGSHTAALHAPYTDRPEIRPGPRYDPQELAAHVAECTRIGLQAGFHAIGDAAVDAVLAGVELAAARCAPGSVAAARHRVEHAELVSDPMRVARSGLVASMQPVFDALWGGPGGLYETRLGAARAATMNDLAALLSAGVPLAFGSDSPVTPLNPWAVVRAAAYPHRSEAAISVRAAFAASTRGGWRAARCDGDGSGVLAVGAPATYAVWTEGPLRVDAPDERIARWSTDPHATLAGLPDVAPGAVLPRCLRTVVRGATAYDAGEL
ncbi:MAG: amidohydrolase family protein [bacterium]